MVNSVQFSHFVGTLTSSGRLTGKLDANHGQNLDLTVNGKRVLIERCNEIYQAGGELTNIKKYTSQEGLYANKRLDGHLFALTKVLQAVQETLKPGGASMGDSPNYKKHAFNGIGALLKKIEPYNKLIASLDTIYSNLSGLVAGELFKSQEKVPTVINPLGVEGDFKGITFDEKGNMLVDIQLTKKAK